MTTHSHGFITCPKCKASARSADGTPHPICTSCGLVFAKYAAASTPATANDNTDPEEYEEEAPPQDWKARWLLPPPADDALSDHELWWARGIGLLLLCWWGLHFIRMDWHTNTIGESFMHNINLVFHEAGHVIFRPFGRLLMFFGGSFFQFLWPLILAGFFVFKYRNPFAGAVCVAWAGQSLMDVAPYIGDARSLQLGLIGEYSEDIVDMRSERHDWHNILGDLGWLAKDQMLANLAHNMGRLIILAAIAWAAAVVYAQYKSHQASR